MESGCVGRGRTWRGIKGFRSELIPFRITITNTVYAVLKNEIGHRLAKLAALTHIHHADLCIIYCSSSTLLYQEVES
jgi:hypothetical protein